MEQSCNYGGTIGYGCIVQTLEVAVVASTYVFQVALVWIVKSKGGVVIYPSM